MLLLACLLSGCGRGGEHWLRQAEKAEQAAQTAQLKADPEAANRAAEAARDAVTHLEALVAADKKGSANLRQLLRKAQLAERSAQEHAALAAEERERRDKLGGLKLRAFLKARTIVLTTVLPGMALAAEKAGARGTNQMTSLEQSLAAQAWSLAALLSHRPPLPDGQPDWPGVASVFRQWSTNPPIEFRAFLGLALALAVSDDFALAEFESVDSRSLSGTNALMIYHGGRALIYARQGWSRLATPEVEAFCRYAELSQGPVSGQQLLALFHAFLACDALEKLDFNRMDAEISQSVRSWPDNPVVVFLTGERLAANGEWEKAAVSLETKAAGTENEWIARRLAQRARDLRDGKGTAKALVLDSRFLAEMTAHYVAKASGQPGKKLEEAVTAAKEFGRSLVEKLPLLGSPENAGDVSPEKSPGSPEK